MSGPEAVKAVDLDLDGDLDLVSANSGSDNITTYSNPGFTPTSFGSQTNPVDPGVA
jgi:hypothetical protein